MSGGRSGANQRRAGQKDQRRREEVRRGGEKWIMVKYVQEERSEGDDE